MYPERDKNPVIIYSPLRHSKHAWLSSLEHKRKYLEKYILFFVHWKSVRYNVFWTPTFFRVFFFSFFFCRQKKALQDWDMVVWITSLKVSNMHHLTVDGTKGVPLRLPFSQRLICLFNKVIIDHIVMLCGDLWFVAQISNQIIKPDWTKYTAVFVLKGRLM